MLEAWKLLDLSSFEQRRFPEELCVSRNPKEQDVFESDQLFLCIVVDRRFKKSFRGVIAKPYLYKDLDFEDPSEGVMYGWVDTNGNIIDHFEKQIHLDDEVVIAWKKLDNSAD